MTITATLTRIETKEDRDDIDKNTSRMPWR